MQAKESNCWKMCKTETQWNLQNLTGNWIGVLALKTAAFAKQRMKVTLPLCRQVHTLELLQLSSCSVNLGNREGLELSWRNVAEGA